MKKIAAAFRSLVIIAIAIVVFVEFIQISDIDSNQMSRLIVSSLGTPFFQAKPQSAHSAATASSQFAEVKTQGARNPSNTGSYTALWDSVKQPTTTMLLFVEYLPTAASASVVQDQMRSTFLSEVTSNGATTTHTRISTIPGAVSSKIVTKKTATAPATATDTLIFHYGRVTYGEILGGPTADDSLARRVAEREYTLLKKTEPQFTLVRKSRPIGISLPYFIFIAIAALLAFFGPEMIRSQKIKRAAHQQARTRYHYQVRGAKVLKGQRARSGRH